MHVLTAGDVGKGENNVLCQQISFDRLGAQGKAVIALYIAFANNRY